MSAFKSGTIPFNKTRIRLERGMVSLMLVGDADKKVTGKEKMRKTTT